ncbi:MAG: hypothetical protein ACREKN_07640 [Longimicrobiaceae bacterium]
MRVLRATLPFLALLSPACGNGDGPFRLPPADSAAALYEDGAQAEARGNLLEVSVPFGEEYRRGGSLWARSGPYFYLFSEPTEKLMAAYPQLAAVRVVMHTPGGEEVARATLARAAITEFDWRRARNLAAVAQLRGTEEPGRLAELVRWGEAHTEYRYNPGFVPR